MSQNLRKVVVLGGQRIPFCKAGTNYYKESSQKLMNVALEATVKHFKLEGQTLGEVALGNVVAHSKDWALAREAVLASSLSHDTPAVVVQRACGTSLEAATMVASKIMTGHIESGIVGGSESLSDVPITYKPEMARRIVEMSKARGVFDKAKVWRGLSFGDMLPAAFGVIEPTTGKTMGQHCEMMAKEWHIRREDQDELALQSHKNAAQAQSSGFFSDLITPHLGVTQDNTVRGNTTLEKLSQLKPSFDKTDKGTLTAGNSSPLTDGAACALLSSEEWAVEHDLPMLAYIKDYQIAAVDIQKEGLLMAPAYAVPKMLERNGLKLQDFDFYEIHEAFAAQVLCTLKAWESAEFCKKIGLKGALGTIDRTKLNVCGGSLAVGHPFGATGARLIANLAKMLSQKGSGRGLISVCTGGGMGVTAILER